MDWIRAEFAFETMRQQRMLVKLLRAVRLFEGLAPAELRHLLLACERSVLANGDWVFREGERARFMYVIVAGEVEIVKMLPTGEEARLAVLGAGDAFGEMALIDHMARSASVRARGACTLLRTGDDGFWDVPTLAAKLYRNIACSLSARLRQTNATTSLLLAEREHLHAHG